MQEYVWTMLDWRVEKNKNKKTPIIVWHLMSLPISKALVSLKKFKFKKTRQNKRRTQHNFIVAPPMLHDRYETSLVIFSGIKQTWHIITHLFFLFSPLPSPSKAAYEKSFFFRFRSTIEHHDQLNHSTEADKADKKRVLRPNYKTCFLHFELLKKCFKGSKV
jgi:hypothetical protein